MNNHEQQAKAIVDQMTLDEKITQLVHEAKGISRLNIPAYNWWNECLHGVGRAGIATVFPQPIGMAAMFDEPFVNQIADAISDEVRAKYNLSRQAMNKMPKSLFEKLPGCLSSHLLATSLQYQGLTCWSPNINLFRDPRWGRGHETYGEDPYLTTRLGVAFIKGLQGNDDQYLKTVATPKHFAVHSGPEAERHRFNVNPTKKDLHETYLPAFKGAIIEAKAASIMTAYNAVNGVPAVANTELLDDILRDGWGFEGYVVSDCGAVCDIHRNHRLTSSAAESAALAINAGCDLICGRVVTPLRRAVRKGFIPEPTINRSLYRLYEARVRLGMFAPSADLPWQHLGIETLDSEAHRALALEASRKSLVLLKNDGILPLSRTIRKIAVIGPNADSLDVLLGNYNGQPSSYTTLLQGLRNRFDGNVTYRKGCHLTKNSTKDFQHALNIANASDLIVYCFGLSPKIENEEGAANHSGAYGDKSTLALPKIQDQLLEVLFDTGKPIVGVNLSGSPVDLRNAQTKVNALIQGWYPGQDGGQAIAELLFGDFSPSGRLPVTFVKSDADLPNFEDYHMKGRTYRYLETTPLYPFGFGLTYADFTYEHLQGSWSETNERSTYEVSVRVTNLSDTPSEEVVQFYLKHHDETVRMPHHALCGFQRVHIAPHECKTVTQSIPRSAFSSVSEDGNRYMTAAHYTLYAGGQQPDSTSTSLTNKTVLHIDIQP